MKHGIRKTGQAVTTSFVVSITSTLVASIMYVTVAFHHPTMYSDLTEQHNYREFCFSLLPEASLLELRIAFLYRHYWSLHFSQHTINVTEVVREPDSAAKTKQQRGLVLANSAASWLVANAACTTSSSSSSRGQRWSISDTTATNAEFTLQFPIRSS